MKISVAKVDAETKKPFMQVCLLNFSRLDDLEGFQTALSKGIEDCK